MLEVGNVREGCKNSKDDQKWDGSKIHPTSGFGTCREKLSALGKVFQLCTAKSRAFWKSLSQGLSSPVQSAGFHESWTLR